jgi:hypothetical protein
LYPFHDGESITFIITAMPNLWKYLTALLGGFFVAKLVAFTLMPFVFKSHNSYFELLGSSMLWLILALACIQASCARAAWGRLFDITASLIFLAGIFTVYVTYTIESHSYAAATESPQVQELASSLSSVTAILLIGMAIIIATISKAIKATIKHPSSSTPSSRSSEPLVE